MRLLTAFVLLLVACGADRADKARSPGAASEPPAEEFPYHSEPFPQSLADSIRSASVTKVYAVAGPFDALFDKNKAAPRIVGAVILGQREVSGAQADEIASRLMTSKYLDVSSIYTCLPRPRYVIEFTRGESNTLAVIDGCSSVVIYDKNPEMPPWSHAFDPRDDPSCSVCDLLEQVVPYPAE